MALLSLMVGLDYAEEVHVSVLNINQRQRLLEATVGMVDKMEKIQKTKSNKRFELEFSGGQGSCPMGFEVAQETRSPENSLAKYCHVGSHVIF